MGKDQELLEAARKGNVAVVEKILGQRAKRSGPLASLRRGPGANVQDSSGYSALHHAALNGHAEIVKLLLEHDASTNIVDAKGSSPLHLAAWSGNVGIVKLLLAGPSICNVNLTTKDDETALHCAAQYGHTPVVCLLLEHACDPGIRNCRGETALDLAAQYGRLETVELLVRTDPTLIQCLKRTIPDTVFPHTPLHLASRNGHKAVVEVLLRAGFNVNMRTKSGTALHEAALCGKVEVVRTLLEHGVNTSIRDYKNYTVMDLLSQFNTAQASQEIMNILKRHKRGLPLVDSDGESISNPFPPVPNTDSDLGSPYENMRPSSKNSRFVAPDPSPGTSPHRWDCQRHARPPEGFEDRRVSGVSGISIMNHSNSADTKTDENDNNDTYVPMMNLAQIRNSKPYKSLPSNKRTKPKEATFVSPLEGITFKFTEKLDMRKISSTTTDSYVTAEESISSSDSSRESDNSLYQIPCAPKQFMDSSMHSEDLNYLCTNRESDQISIASTASSCGYPRRPDSGGVPLYIPMTNPRGGHSPGSTNSKVSPTPPKKPPRRNISVSPTHIQPMSMSVDGVSNSAYEYLFLAHSGTRSQGNLTDFEKENRRERLAHGRSMDQYVEMNVFNIALDDEEPERPRSELQRGKSEDLDNRKKPEPIAITSMYENMIIRQQNPRRKLRRNHEVYEDHSFKRKDKEEVVACSSAPETTFVSSAYIMVSDNAESKKDVKDPIKKPVANFPLSPTHYNQPPTPDHPPPSAMQAENVIFEKIRPLSQPVFMDIVKRHGSMTITKVKKRHSWIHQEYKRRSKDMETETEEEYLLICDESNGSISSSVSLSDRSVDNILEEYHSDTPFAGLIRGSKPKVLETVNSNTPAERPKTLKKLKRVYESTNGDNIKSDNDVSSSSEKEFDNKENKERVTALSPFDEQEEWAKIQEIMASFGTGIVRESVFVAELEKEFQSRLMTISCSQNSLNGISGVGSVEKWLQGLGVGDYASLFISNGFDNIDFMNGVLDESDLKDMGISSEPDRQVILDAVKQLPLKISDYFLNNNNEQNAVRLWLRTIHLEHYYETFDKHLYHDMERIKRIWDVELSAVLDIEKIGHRKRILASVSSGEHIVTGPKLEEINADLNLLKPAETSNNDIPSPSALSTKSTSSNTGTIRHRHKKSRPAPPPPVNIVKNPPPEKKGPLEIFVGGSNSIKSQWRHQPILLITGQAKYSANYLGSTTIKEFKGTESSRKSIQKVLKSKDHPSEEIILSISYRGVKFMNPFTQNTICEHEIKNMNCACQDNESQCHFAYITKDADLFYCHVFQAISSELAMDIIFTLGQAFELAYQMALRDQVTSRTKGQRESHKPAVSPGSASVHSREFKDNTTRSTDVKMNGHPLKMMPLTLSLAVEPGSLEAGPSHKTPTKGQVDKSQT